MRWIVVFLLLASPALADTGHMTLLTVSDDGETGGTADVFLTVRDGDGGVFIDSFPLSRLDTQSSTRYANQVACNFLEADCSGYDFFYTIRAGSSIVGGPSAGAAIAVLTVAVLDGQTVDNTTAMTGTINSGGIIGPVGGIGAKLAAAEQAGLRQVIIPGLATLNDTNISAFEDMTVRRVQTLEEALLLATGKDYDRPLRPLAEPAAYTQRMRDVSYDICARNAYLRAELEDLDIPYNDSNNYTQRIARLPEDRAYTLASLCFSSNIELNRLRVGEMSGGEQRRLHGLLRDRIIEMDDDLREREIVTVSDLEVYNIVRERIVEADETLADWNASDVAGLAYAQERLVSAESWSEFFGMPADEVVLDEEYLEKACLQKLSEAEERINYVGLYVEVLTTASRETLARARRFKDRDPVLCIFTASQAKAQANSIVSTLFLEEENLDLLLDEKLQAARMVIQKEMDRGYFPVLGYSYLKYSEDLAERQPYSALLFAEYGLELSGLGMYFPEENRVRLPSGLPEGLWLFAMGAIFGAAVVLLIFQKKIGP